ncbi:hypothetical protein [Psychroflexus sp. MES1-P1E]|uniref:hypothetical protein n=1 Tax=Psychroflexus sp. MES1-P1E TaxID=2058320 RepID=UPI0015E0D152|nr:hypothetical protein [Psychroflexus sp. MES1-P1E]
MQRPIQKEVKTLGNKLSILVKASHQDVLIRLKMMPWIDNKTSIMLMAIFFQ